ncbi:hypothetical protein NUW54_g13514 [Trametes sanguinea]|uniref:Uncharacterized protein n=1 Tax=Trametes sanguinea TaxID=158606 RepID=A0ACC1MLH4_9APHY|nr:hypothetical protein NUW54_g13514 [Trametes sanguinea]
MKSRAGVLHGAHGGGQPALDGILPHRNMFDCLGDSPDFQKGRDLFIYDTLLAAVHTSAFELRAPQGHNARRLGGLGLFRHFPIDTLSVNSVLSPVTLPSSCSIPWAYDVQTNEVLDGVPLIGRIPASLCPTPPRPLWRCGANRV